MKTKPTTIRSHYLPRTYLKHFLNNEQLFVYLKGEKFFKKADTTPEERILTVNGEEALVNIGLEKHLYDPKIEGLTADDLEDIFNDYGESFYDEVITEIETLPTGAPISEEMKGRLCMFMASMRVRTPFFKQEVEMIDESFRKHIMSKEYGRLTPEEIVQMYKEKEGKEISLDVAKKVKDSFANKKYDLKYPNAFFIKVALMLLEEQVDIFHQMTLKILRSDRIFITSDNPVVYFVPLDKVDVYNNYKSLTSRYCELFFPLTKNMGVYMSWRKGREEVLSGTHEMVNTFNENLSINSWDFIISPLKLNLLKKFTESHIPYPLKFTIS